MKSINTNRAILVLFIAAFLFGIAMPVKAEVVPASISLGASNSVDIDTGIITSNFTSRDLFYENFDGTRRYLVPQNGAMFANLGVVNFDAIIDASPYRLSSSRINASLNNNSIPVGAVLIVKTNMGNYAKMRIDAYPDPIDFALVYQNNGSPIIPELSSVAIVVLFLPATLAATMAYRKKH